MNIGMVGGGQLGRMLALAGVPMGFRFRVLDPQPDCPASVVAGQVVGEYDDYAALAEFVTGLDVVTYEFENVPVATARWLADRVPVYPPPGALEVAQDRWHEKTFFRDLGADGPRFACVDTREQLEAAVRAIGLPAVLKTRRFGYDGKGQRVIRTSADLGPAWERLGGRPLILEEFVRFDRELSILAVRSSAGAIAFSPLIENDHHEGILRSSRAPFVDDVLTYAAGEIAGRALARLEYVGALAIEYFQQGDRLLVNEMAPRVHNSGHWTIEGAATSQFANHLRAITGLPLGRFEPHGWAGMVNCVGRLPDPAAVGRIPGASFHDYGKQPRAGRKVGHVTVTARTEAERDERLAAVEGLVEKW